MMAVETIKQIHQDRFAYSLGEFREAIEVAKSGSPDREGVLATHQE